MEKPLFIKCELGCEAGSIEDEFFGNDLLKIKVEPDDAFQDASVKEFQEELKSQDVNEECSYKTTFKNETQQLSRSSGHGVHVEMKYTDDSRHSQDVSSENLGQKEVILDDYNTEESWSSVPKFDTGIQKTGSVTPLELNNIEGNKLSSGTCGKTEEKLYTTSNSGSNSDYVMHKVVKKREERFHCSVCAKPFCFPSDVRRHMLVHTGERLRPYSCHLCEKAFTVKTALDRHLRRHTGQKPHVCNICRKSFSTKCGVKTHMVTHIGKKYFALKS